MATRLKLYNGALRILGERKLASLTENREPRRVLDDMWDDDFTNTCLEQGMWNFATRSIELTYSPSVTPSFGYIRAFDKPSDWVRTTIISIDEYFSAPMLQYVDEAGYWRCEYDTIYVKYVSNDSSYGNDLSLWPSSFVRYFEAALAFEACDRITKSDSKRDEIRADVRRLLADARSKDAMNQPIVFPPAGSWATSRRVAATQRERGKRGQLIG